MTPDVFAAAALAIAPELALQEAERDVLKRLLKDDPTIDDMRSAVDQIHEIDAAVPRPATRQPTDQIFDLCKTASPHRWAWHVLFSILLWRWAGTEELSIAVKLLKQQVAAKEQEAGR